MKNHFSQNDHVRNLSIKFQNSKILKVPWGSNFENELQRHQVTFVLFYIKPFGKVCIQNSLKTQVYFYDIYFLCISLSCNNIINMYIFTTSKNNHKKCFAVIISS